MDEADLVEWRRVRDAADGDALAHLCGDDTFASELQLRAALAFSRTRSTGLVGMVKIHEQRAGQTSDPEWRVGHSTAVEHYRGELEATEGALRDALACLTHADGAALATTIVTLARTRGGRFGADELWLRRALVDLQEARIRDGVRGVAREWLRVTARVQNYEGRWLRRGIIAPHEMADDSWRALRVMWQAADSENHKAEVIGIIEGYALSAIEHGDFHDLYLAERAQLLGTGQSFAVWLQVLFDQAVADSLHRDLDEVASLAPRDTE